MPWKSDAQRRWGHTAEGEKALGGKSAVSEWDNLSKGAKLPDHVKGATPQNASYAEGGSVLPRSGDWKKSIPNRGFLDTPDRFTGGRKPADYPQEKKTDEDWAKTSGPKGDVKPVDKSEKPVLPRK
jgi:hypothetical protein